jgi:hypothetical protein
MLIAAEKKLSLLIITSLAGRDAPHSSTGESVAKHGRREGEEPMIEQLPSSRQSEVVGEADDLGELVYVQRIPYGAGLLMLLLGAGLLVGFILYPAAFAWLGVKAALFSIVFGCILVGLGVWSLWHNFGIVWYFHERGARRRGLRGRESFLYEEVEEVGLGTKRTYLRDTDTGRETHEGTVQAATFRLGPPQPRTVTITYDSRLRLGLGTGHAEMAEIERVCDTVAELIATRMAKQLAAGEAVRWTRELTLTPDGVEIQGKWGERSGATWEQIDRTELGLRSTRTTSGPAQHEEPVLRLWRKGEVEPCAEVPTGTLNFLPGYKILAKCLAQESGIGNQGQGMAETDS